MLIDDTPSTSATSASSHPSSISCRARRFMSGLIFRYTMASTRQLKRKFGQNTFFSFFSFFLFFNIFQHLHTCATSFSENSVEKTIALNQIDTTNYIDHTIQRVPTGISRNHHSQDFKLLSHHLACLLSLISDAPKGYGLKMPMSHGS